MVAALVTAVGLSTLAGSSIAQSCGGGAAADGSSTGCDPAYRDQEIRCGADNQYGTHAPCSKDPMPAKSTALRTFKDFSPYLWAVARNQDGTIYNGTYARGTVGDPTQNTTLTGEDANNPENQQRVSPQNACVNQIEVKSGLSAREQAVVERVRLDNCSNQYILHAAADPEYRSDALQLSGENPEDPAARISLKTHCQPLRTTYDSTQEYSPADYLKAAWTKLLVNPSYRKTPGAAKEPHLPNGVTLQNTNSDKLKMPERFPENLSQLGATQEGGATNYEAIYDPSHPFSPRWDFKGNERGMYSPMTAVYSNDLRNAVYCAGNRGDSSSSQGDNKVYKVDVLEFRRKKFEEGMVKNRIGYNTACFLDRFTYTGPIAMVAATSYCYQVLNPSTAQRIPCWQCFGLTGRVGKSIGEQLRSAVSPSSLAALGAQSLGLSSVSGQSLANLGLQSLGQSGLQGLGAQGLQALGTSGLQQLGVQQLQSLGIQQYTGMLNSRLNSITDGNLTALPSNLTSMGGIQGLSGALNNPLSNISSAIPGGVALPGGTTLPGGVGTGGQSLSLPQLVQNIGGVPSQLMGVSNQVGTTAQQLGSANTTLVGATGSLSGVATTLNRIPGQSTGAITGQLASVGSTLSGVTTTLSGISSGNRSMVSQITSVNSTLQSLGVPTGSATSQLGQLVQLSNSTSQLGNIAGGLGGLSGGLGGVSTTLSQTTGQLQNISGQLGSQVGQIVGPVNSQLAELKGQMGEQLAGVNSQLSQVTGALSGQIGGAISGVNTALGDIQGQIGGMMGEVNGAIGGVMSEINGAIGGVTSEINGAISGVTSEINSAISGVTSEINGMVSEISGQINSAISGVMDQVNGAISSVTDSISQSISGITDSISGAMGDALGGAMGDALGGLGGVSGPPDPPCTTRYDGEDMEMKGDFLPGLLNGFQMKAHCTISPTDTPTPASTLCKDLRRPLTVINVLKMRYHNPQDKEHDELPNGAPKGYAFKDYFEDHMPYPRLLDTGRSIQKNPSTDQDPMDTTGQYTTIVGVGREAVPSSQGQQGGASTGATPSTGGAGGSQQNDRSKDERCLYDGWGGSASGGGISVEESDPVTSWTGLKLYQARTLREARINCVGKYEKVFKPRSTEGQILNRMGGEITRIRSCTRGEGGAMSCSYYGDNQSVPQGAIVQYDNLTIPLSWRGYVSDPDTSRRFPNGAGTRSGLDNAQCGDIIVMPNGDSTGSAGKAGLPKLALVVSINLPGRASCDSSASSSSSSSSTSRDNYSVVVEEADAGKWPDVCGGTEVAGGLQRRTLYKPGHFPSDGERELRRIKWDTHGCEDPGLIACEFSQWSSAKLYRPGDDVRSGGDGSASPTTGGGGTPTP